MKLSKSQIKVINLMNDSWQLVSTMGLYNQVFWLQKGGCGRGGESINVNANTVRSLIKAGIITMNTREYPLQTYRQVERIKMQLTETERAIIRAWLEEQIETNTNPLDVNRVVEIGKLMKELEVNHGMSIKTNKP